MKATLRKTTLGEHNNGITTVGNPFNCYYKGKAMCWEVLIGGESHVALNKKSVAQSVVNWVNSGEWHGRGDVMMAWSKWHNENDRNSDWMLWADGIAKEV